MHTQQSSVYACCSLSKLELASATCFAVRASQMQRRHEYFRKVQGVAVTGQSGLRQVASDMVRDWRGARVYVDLIGWYIVV